jgi:hypothetical protein
MFIILVILAVVYILSAVFNLISSRVSVKLSQSTIRKLRKDLFDNLVFLPIRYFDNHQHGDIMSRMSNDSATIARTISQSITSLVSAILTVIGALAVMIWKSPLLTLTCVVSLVLTLLATSILSKFMKKYFRLERSLIGEINAQVEEMVVGDGTMGDTHFLQSLGGADRSLQRGANLLDLRFVVSQCTFQIHDSGIILLEQLGNIGKQTFVVTGTKKRASGRSGGNISAKQCFHSLYSFNK